MKTQFTNTVDGRNTPFGFNHSAGTNQQDRKSLVDAVLAENGESITIEVLGKTFESTSFYKSLSGKSWNYSISITEDVYKHFCGNYGIKKNTNGFFLEIDSNGFGYLRTGSSYVNFDLSKITIK